MSTKSSATPRERLLDAADKLFYEEGIHTVGIDRVIEAAGVAKASLYSAFGSKDALVCAYIAARQEARKKRIEQAMARHSTPRAQLIAVFDLLATLVASPGFRGCAFVRASTESPADTAVTSVCAEARAWMRSVLTRLASEAGAPDADRVGRQIGLLYDGATVSASMERDASAVTLARDIAVDLFDAAVGPRAPQPSVAESAVPRATKRVRSS